MQLCGILSEPDGWKAAGLSFTKELPLCPEGQLCKPLFLK